MPVQSPLIQLFWLLILAVPIGCITWTLTHEEVFREPREWCLRKSKSCRRFAPRKFFYVFTCEYCLSHYVTVLFLAVTGLKLLFADWRGYLISGFALVWIANFYMAAFARLRLDVKRERVEIARKNPARDQSRGKRLRCANTDAPPEPLKLTRVPRPEQTYATELRGGSMSIRVSAWRGALGMAIVCVLAAAATAQNVPQQFVVSGKAAERIEDYTTINLATAERIVEGCEAAVTARGGGVHTIIVLDNDGNRVYMDRMDGQGYLNIITAEMKARTALLTRQPSKAAMNRVSRNPNDEAYEVQLGFYPVAGGLPIVVNHQMIGVVGAGGYRPNPPVWSDEICVHTALEKVIGSSIPALIEDVPPQENGRGNAPVPHFAVSAPPKPSIPSEYLVPAADAAKVFDGDQISLATAKKIARACRDSAAAKGTTMTAYVLDTEGEMVHMEHMDGELSIDNRTALMKAQTALRLREPTSIRGTQLKNNPEGGVPRTIDAFHFYLAPGGIPIVVDGQMIGSVGVSGSDASQDENCAIAGLKAAFGDRATLPVYPNGSAGGE